MGLRRKTVLLGLAATAAVVYSAIDLFGFDSAVVLEYLSMSVLLVVGAAALAALIIALWRLSRRLNRFRD